MHNSFNKTDGKDTFFYQKQTLNCKGNLLVLDEPIIMGILNVTPDSFFDGNEHNTEDIILRKAEQFLKEGAKIIDIGGYSSRPGATDISEDEELKRVIPTIESILKKYPDTLISIDTFRSNVAKEAIKSGAALINDISAGTLDKSMFTTVSNLNVPYIMMHMKGTPQTMKEHTDYNNLMQEMITYFSEKVEKLRSLGVKDIVLDPGFGFAKTVDQNYDALKHLMQLRLFNLPILVGVSRKSMINKVLDITPKEALNGTTVLNTIALINGAKILRVHDVKEAKEAIKLTSKIL